MYFTEEDLLKIEKFLSARGVKDSHFGVVVTADGNDYVPILHNGDNKRITIENLLSFSGDFINATERYNTVSGSISVVAEAIPAKRRVSGLVVTFKDDHGQWHLNQYISDSVANSDWVDENNWAGIAGGQSIAVDEETIIINDNDCLQVADESLSRGKLASDVTGELDGLQNQIIELFKKHLKLTLSANKTLRYYKGYPLAVNLTLTFEDSGDVNDNDISNLEINESGIGKIAYNANSHTLQKSLNIASVNTFTGAISFTYSGASINIDSNTLTSSEANPIYYGVLPANYTQQDIDGLINQNHVYSLNNPLATIKNANVTYTLTNSSRACLIVAENNISALDGGFNHPLVKTSQDINGTAYYVYVSENTYSGGSHTLNFK